LLQRALGIGYGRGARLIDYMAEDGIVGAYNGSQAREVLMTVEQWEEMCGQRSASAADSPARGRIRNVVADPPQANRLASSDDEPQRGSRTRTFTPARSDDEEADDDGDPQEEDYEEEGEQDDDEQDEYEDGGDEDDQAADDEESAEDLFDEGEDEEFDDEADSGRLEAG
jgi:S-DNA-T family DNA segregation ATPase FtsK/SpoIIIE